MYIIINITHIIVICLGFDYYIIAANEVLLKPHRR